MLRVWRRVTEQSMPVACIIEARIVVSEDVIRNLDLLVGLQFATLLPLEVTE